MQAVSGIAEWLNPFCANPTKWSNTIKQAVADELFECV